jgi:tRNA threonylcarbamoyladenosine biosynthesis protein TsaE
VDCGLPAIVETASAEATVDLGRELALTLRPGDVVAFCGELGSGKTTMIKGICAGLRVRETVRSPSFVVAAEYLGICLDRPIRIAHVDLYRLHGVSDLGDIGFSEYVAGDGITLVEWAERAREALPAGAIQVELRVKAETRRTITLTRPA